MRPDEARDLARLGGRAACGVEGLVEATHHAVTDQAYETVGAVVGDAVRPIRTTHDLLARHAFFWVRTGLRAASWAAGAAAHEAARAGQRGGMDAERTDGRGLDSVRAQLALGIVNGVTGDRLSDDASSLAWRMTVREGGRDVPLTGEGLKVAYGTGRQRIVVFLHGLVETEHAWRYRSQHRWGRPGTSYATLLADESDWKPVLVRYNTGRGVADNAAALDALLARLVRAWPGPLTEISLVGHSMGGLVGLGALAAGDPCWTRLVRTVVTLGSPIDGAPLERFAEAVVQGTARRSAWRWLGGLIGIRSVGIRDLHDALDHAPLPPGVRHDVVLASIAPNAWPPSAPRVGDGLVPIPKDPREHTLVLGGMHHLDLLNHPRVYAHLRACLDRSPVPLGR